MAQNRLFRRFALRTPEQGADTLVFLAEDPADPQGEYFANRKVTRANKQSYDQALAGQLWDRSMAMIG